MFGKYPHHPKEKNGNPPTNECKHIEKDGGEIINFIEI